MPKQFHKHYNLQEARSLLPLVRRWLGELIRIRLAIHEHENWSREQIGKGFDVGGHQTNAWIKDIAKFNEVSLEFRSRGILLKDIDRGLIDFPALRLGKEVLFCWELCESDILYWHDLESGYSGRKPIDDLFQDDT